MNEVKFLLKEPKRKEKTPIYLVYRFNGYKLKITTGLKIAPKGWNFSNQRMRELAGSSHRNFNRKLKLLADEIINIHLEFEANGILPTPDQIKQKYRANTGRDNNQQYRFVNQYLDEYVKKLEKERGKQTSRFFDIATKKLKEFKPNLTWLDLEENNYKQFLKWMNKNEYSTNYTGTIINRLRIMFNAAHREGFLKHTNYKTWKKIEEEVYKIYLTEDEILQIYNLELKDSIDRARDLFIIGCCTGLRVGNYLKIDPNLTIDMEAGFIHAIVNKNGPKIMIPIHWMVNNILRKYDNELPKPMAEQNLNSFIKDFCEAADIDEEIIWSRTEGGIRKVEKSKKWELATTHTARRSFATNLYLRGENPKVIMDVTGHKTLKMFFRYIKVQKEESARKLAQSDFFKAKA